MKGHLFLLCACIFIGSSAQSTEFISAVNSVRSNVHPPAAVNLTSLSWSTDLQAKAQIWTNQCIIGPNPANRWLRTEAYVLDTSRNLTIAQIVKQWSLESRSFNWDLFHIRNAKNYTAIVWENTTQVGCAFTSCKEGVFYQCVFSTRGNYPGLLPYKAKCNYQPNFSCTGKCGTVFDGCTNQNCGPCIAPSIPKRGNYNHKRDITSQCLNYEGCFSSPSAKPIMTGASWTDTSKVNVESCSLYCVNQGFTFAGLQNGSTCLCDNGYAGNNGTCDVACAGNSAEYCGGSDAVQVYDVSACNGTGQCQQFGCLNLNNFHWETGYTMSSVASCINYCSSKGYTYGGLTDPYCYCANSFANSFETSSPACPSNINKCADGSYCGTTDGNYVNVFSVMNCAAPRWVVHGYATDMDSYKYTPAFDWRTRGNIVGAVRNQGSCGCCWAFASTGALESTWAVAYGQNVLALSEQQIVSCGEARGCQGGNNGIAYDFVQSNKGQAFASDFPYTVQDASSGTPCPSTQPTNSPILILPNTTAPSSIKRAGGNNEDSIKYALQFGPVYMGVGLSSSFNSYAGGVYTDDNWATETSEGGHAMLIVGYGTDQATGLDYWLVRNQWGVGWGLNGYVLWARNRAGGTGGILSQIAQPNIYIPVTNDTFASQTFQIKQKSTGNCLTDSQWNQLSVSACSSTKSRIWQLTSVTIQNQYIIQSQNQIYVDDWYYTNVNSQVMGSSGSGIDLNRIVWVVEPQTDGSYKIMSVYNSFTLGTSAGSSQVIHTDPTPLSDDNRWDIITA
ncbi:cysteine proteinase [Planoprotostelium fungivorum]|uniref:Cysteine proteinase n=1 Tax=Planoprotostelium fungivorum TaxID=1890364 RepID=A0A2P6NZW8_9EUKA|nr:cysteine proteinase [Planoprotostelium fungivorum]